MSNKENVVDLEHKYNVVLKNIDCMIKEYKKIEMPDIVERLTKVRKDIVEIFIDTF